ncbi:MAG: hypothetical protein ACHQQQ_01145 [Bacteroidota bacterium]
MHSRPVSDYCAAAVLMVLLTQPLYSQESKRITAANLHRETFSLSSLDSTIRLGHQFIIEGSDSVWLDSIVIRRGFDYLIDLRYGTIQFRKDTLQARFTKHGSKHTVEILYRFFPFTFQDEYKRHEVVIHKDTVTGKVEKIAKPFAPFTINDIFGSNIQKSGSIVRGFSMGTNRDLTLSSGFHMQMSGKISNNIDIVAALTDENIPIQPEGTTQNLNEVDKVFVQIRSANLGATLGDFNLGLTGNEFGTFNRKLQGAEGTAHYSTDLTDGNVLLSAATSRGKYTTNDIPGLDAVQGPYTLLGKNNQRNIIVIAGTEKVYVDGELMVRGEINDYTIDYSNAQITFTSKRMINRASRITVDFQYTDQQYTRNLFAAKTENSFFNNRVNFHATYITESDDQNSPINVTLSDTDKAVLTAAGNNQALASRSGVDSLGAGLGQYIKVDTTIIIPDSTAPRHLSIYRYEPEDTLHAIYSVTFSFLGAGAGDYIRITPGQFQFVGIRAGSYAPIRLLPLPESHSITDFDGSAQITDALKVNGEVAVSNYNQNKFSSIDEANNSGSAVNVGIQYAPEKIRFGTTDLGSLKLDIKNRYLAKNFNPIDRIDPIEFNRLWNIQDNTPADENLFQANLSYQPVTFVNLTGSGGQVKKGDYSTSNRYIFGAKLIKDEIPSADYTVDFLNSRNDLIQATTQWIRDGGSVEYKNKTIIPGLGYSHEYRSESAAGLDTTYGGSFRFREITPRLTLQNISGMTLKTDFGYRVDDSLFNNTLTRASQIITQHYELQLPSSESFTSSLNVTVRDRKFTNDFITRNNVDSKTTLLRSQTRFNPFSRGIESEWFYEASAERSAKNIRIFQQVPKGTGNYIYAGDLNHNHIVDEPDFQQSLYDGDYIAVIVPSDQYIPVTDLKVSSRIRLNGSKFFSKDRWYTTAFSSLSSESYLRVSEKSSNPTTRDVYFLHLGTFLNDQTTLDGSNLITEDLYVLENNSAFSMRLHYDQTNGFTQYSLQNERVYNHEQSIRLRWHLVEEISNQIDVIQKIDNLSSTQLSNRVRGIASSSLSSDWSYRPVQKVELGFKFGVGRAINFDTTTANLNDQSVRLNYSIETKGQARVEFSREEVLMTNPGLLFPYELTGGKVVGKTWLWRFGFDYRITDFLQSSVNYEGRSENNSVPIHTGRAEVRAFF